MLSQTHELGFSLMELMITVAIIGILSSFAIPAYHDYLIKTRVTELILMAQPTKLAVTEALISGVMMKDINHVSLGLDVQPKSKMIEALEILEGRISVQGNAMALGFSNPESINFKILFTPTLANGLIDWECKIESELFKKYVPPSCKKLI